MKKFILSSLAAFCMLSVSAQDELCAEPLHMAANSTANLVINLKNDHYVRGIQFAIILPEGFDTARGKKTMTVGTDYTLLDRAADVDAIVAVCQRKAITGGIQINYAGGPAIDPEADVDNVEAGEGGVFSFPIKTTAAAGVYPIRVRVDEVSDSEGGLYIQNKYYTSYIVVGDAKATYVATDILPASVNEVLAADANVTAVDLSAVTAVNGTFSYVAGRDVVAPTSAVTANVNYVAPAPAKYATLCLPTEADVDCWVLDRKEGNTAIFKESTVAPANKPVIIENAVETTAASATISAVAKKSITSGTYLVGEELHTVKTSATIPALRGYWEESALSNCRIAFETPTGIQFINAEDINTNAYDLQGRQTTNAKNGVFVVNGKKQFVK